MRGILVQRAASADLEDIESLLSAVDPPPALVERALGAVGAHGAPVVLIARPEDGAPVGLGMLEVETGDGGAAPAGRVTLLVVLDRWRGRGVAAALLEALRTEAAARGCREVRVATPRRAGRP